MPNGNGSAAAGPHRNLTDRAVVVGINRYPALTNLGGPENDATRFVEWLVDPAGGSVPPANVASIVSSTFPDHAVEPTTAAIDAAFEQIINLPPGPQPARRLYVFLAGHGFAPSVAEGALLAANVAPISFGHYIPGRLYCDWFRTAALFEEVVLLMDCCREVRTTVPPRVPPWTTRVGDPPSKMFLGFATEMGRVSRERPSAHDNNQVRGRFTEAVLAGLRHATDERGRVTSKTLPAFVFNLLAKEAEDNHETALNRQEPKFPTTDEIVFAEIGAPYTLTATFAVGEAPDLVAGDLVSVLPPKTADDTTRTWELSPGLYLLRRGARQTVVTLLGTGGEERVAF